MSEDVGWPRRCEGYDCVSSGYRSGLLAHNVSICSGWNINRDDRSAAGVQCRDSCRVQPAHWRPETGSEDRIYQEIGLERDADRFALQLFRRAHEQRAQRQPGEHLRGITAQLRAIRQKNSLRFPSRFMQPARGYETVSAVIALSADYPDP